MDFKNPEKKKIVVVGGVAGGASAAARIRRIDEDAEILILERGEHVSFSNCSLPYYLSDIVDSKEKLLLMSAEKFKNQYNIEVRNFSEVVAIKRKEKCVVVRGAEGKEYEEAYDKLILAPGADALVPPIPGLDQIPHFTVKNVNDTHRLKTHISIQKAKHVTVIGGGFIGIEVAENLREAGYEVSLVEALEQILVPFDFDMVQILHKELLDNGVNLVLADKVSSFAAGKVCLASGREIQTDAVVLSIGVRPAVKFAKESGLEIAANGAIAVDPNQQSSDRHIYAVGDASESYFSLLNKKGLLPLAGPAQKQARNAANHIYGREVDNRGVIASSCIQVFSYNAAATGLNERQIQMNNMAIDYEVVKVIPQDKVGLMPSAKPLHLKLLFEKPSGRILGAQAIGRGAADKRIDIIATLIKMGGTVRDLRDLELCYAPPFSTAKDVSNMAGYVACNLLAGSFRQVDCKQVRSLAEQGAAIIDVREPHEYEKSHIKVAKNIQLSQLRQRISEVPTDKPVYVHCRSGQRSYNACLVLQHHGIDAYNINGGFLGLSFCEAFEDHRLQRESILTDYNFN